MIAVGIAIGIFGYALIYAGVKDIQGVPTGVIESLRPGYQPGKPPPNEGGTGVVGVATELGGALVKPLGVPRLILKKATGH